ncbi:VCBS repeat-containing protein [Candidatus Fermentibacteria bacterium]|nr:VCBS repeat-containing protein [Candidatus Fermentibacteria bacterium]
MTWSDSQPLRVPARTVEDHHDELLAAVPSLTAKGAAVRLLLHARWLPPVEASPQTLFYHVDTVSRLVDLVLAPAPFTGHMGLLKDLRDLLAPTLNGRVMAQVPRLWAAWQRVCALRILELAIRGRQEECATAAAALGCQNHGDIDIDGLLAALLGSWRDGRCEIPWHFRDPAILPQGSVLTVLVDGPDIPSQYREAYLARVSVMVTVKGTRQPTPPTVRARDALGEDVPLGEELKDLVREAVEQAVAFLGPSARARWHRAHLTVELDIRCPFTVTAVTGRSILLPLTLVIARCLGEEFNLSAAVHPDPGIVWTGDLDDHGAVGSVQDLDLKLERVMASRARGFAFPAADRGFVDGASPFVRSEPLALIPLTHLQDAGTSAGVAIRSRSVPTRAISGLRRRARPLGLAGTVAVGLLLAGLALVIGNLATLLDTAPATIRFAGDHHRIEVLNSRERTLRRIPIDSTSTRHPLLVEIDGRGEPEILFGSQANDSPPGMLYCLDSRGRELWRFQGGFRPGEFCPEGMESRFCCDAAYVHDLDHDGKREVVAVFHHTPFYPTQVALLDSEGRYESSFWHAGHLSANAFWVEGSQVLFFDIDADGYDEILLTGANNALNSAVLVVLDPRSIHGHGPTRSSEGSFTWQSYVVFSRSEELHTAMGSDRLHGRDVRLQPWAGASRLRLSVWAHISGRDRIGALTLFLDPDFSVIDIYAADEFIQWMAETHAAGRLSFRFDSPEFQAQMRQVKVISGPPALLYP